VPAREKRGGRERGFSSGESEMDLGVLNQREIGGPNEGEKGRGS
jgi:hypothetical protein